MTSKKLALYKILKYFLFFLLFLVLSFAEINGMRPFAFGMLFALVWCNQKIYIVAPLYLISGIIVELSVTNVLSLSVTCFVFVMFYFLHQKLNKPLNKLLIGLYAFLSQGAFLFLNSHGGEVFFKAICCFVVGMICLYTYLFLMQSLFIRGLRRKFLLDEGICAGVLFLVLGIGFTSIPDYQMMVSKFLFVLLILLFSLCLEKEQSIAFSLLLGIGSLLHQNDFVFFLCLSLMALVLIITSNSKRIFSLLGLILVDAFVNLYFFNYYDIYLFLPTILAGLCVLIIPQKTYNKIKNHFISETEEYCSRDMINRTRQQLFKRLFEVKDVFKEMQNIYLAMSKGGLNPDDAITYVFEQINCNVCGKCLQKSCCPYSQIMQQDEDMKTLIALALSRGKISVIDMPLSFMKNCKKVVVFVNNLNGIVKEYNNYAIINSSVNNSKLLLSEQLGGVQDVLISLSNDINKKVMFDFSLENKIREELMFENILCSEAIIFFQEKKIESVSLNIKTKNINNNKIAKVVSNVMKTALCVYDCKESEKPGYSIVTLKTMHHYDVVFGSCQQTKCGSSISGDTFSVKRINEKNVFMSLCDGMGSGDHAFDISKLSLNLVEKFYEAGFGGSLIVKNVNKLLSLREEDSFSTIDICVFDLFNASCRLIKIGATIGFIKQKQQTQMIETSALPLGILDSVEPTIKNYALSDGDMVVMLSDGVVDSWSDVEKLKNLINNTQTTDPQFLADTILQESLLQTQNYAEDDMTVVVGKIWQKF